VVTVLVADHEPAAARQQQIRELFEGAPFETQGNGANRENRVVLAARIERAAAVSGNSFHR